MEIEIVEFYPIKQEKWLTTGTLHVYIIDLGIDIRGIYVKKEIKKGKISWFFQEPFRFFQDDDKKIKVPFFSFMDKKKQREFISQIRKKGIKYISKQKASDLFF